MLIGHCSLRANHSFNARQTQDGIQSKNKVIGKKKPVLVAQDVGSPEGYINMSGMNWQNDFNFHTKLLIWQGLLPTETPASKNVENFRYFYPRFLLMYLLYNLLIAHPVDMYLNWGDRNNLAVNIAVMIVYGMVIVGTITFLRHGEWFAAWTKLLSDLNHPNKMTEEYDRIAEWTNWFCRWSYLTILRTVQWVGLIIIMTIYFAGLLGFQKRKLLFGCWYPFDATKFPGFDIAMFLQAMNVECFLIISSMDLFTMVNHLRINVQLKILGYKFEHLRETAYRNVQSATDDSHKIRYVHYSRIETLNTGTTTFGQRRVASDDIKTTPSDSDIEQEMHNLLAQYVEQHVVLCRTLREYYSLIDWRSLYQLISNMLCIGVLGLAISNYPVWDATSIGYLLVIVINYIQWFLYCWVPEETAEQSGLISEAVYSSDWLKASPKLRKKLCIVMTFANQPIVAQILEFLPLTLDLFTSVSKRAYSFFTVFDSI